MNMREGMKARVIQWLGYTGVGYALASAGITPGDWRFWLGMVALAVAACANYDEGRAFAPGMPAPGSYRLVERGEVIERGDELLADDTVTWLPVAGWTVGTKWDGGVYVPVRRRTSGGEGTDAK